MRLNFLSSLSPARSHARSRIKLGLQGGLYLGNLNAERDELIEHHDYKIMDYLE